MVTTNESPSSSVAAIPNPVTKRIPRRKSEHHPPGKGWGKNDFSNSQSLLQSEVSHLEKGPVPGVVVLLVVGEEAEIVEAAKVPRGNGAAGERRLVEAVTTKD